jgi:hypothetical protein
MTIYAKMITLGVVLTLGFVSITQAHDGGSWKHRDHYLRAKVSKLHGKRAPGCDLVAGKCKGKKVNNRTVQKYFNTLRSIIAPPRRIVRYVATSRSYRPPVTSSNTGGTTPTYHPPTQTAAPSTAGAPLQAIAQCESGGNPSTNTGNGFYGKYQFTQSTWQSVGGSGNPAAASESEQDQRAAMLYAREGAHPWPVCGR